MPDQTRLLTSLYAVAMGQALETWPAGSADLRNPSVGGFDAGWAPFLTVLAESARADGAELHWIEQGRYIHRCTVGKTADGPLDLAMSERLRTGRVYSQFDLPSDERSKTTLPPLRAMRWRIGADIWGVLVLRRRAGDFRAIDAHQLSVLLPHLAPAMQGWQSLNRARARAALDHQICAGLGAGWIVFTPSGHVSAMADGLEQRLTELADIHLRADQRLTLAPPASRALREAISAVSHRENEPQALSLAPSVRMLLAREIYDGLPRLVGRVRHDVSARSLPLDRVMTGLGLNRSEARLAVALCDGLTLAAAAISLGWTLETARSNSKRLFARLDVHGQPGVVRAMHTSAIW